MSIRYFSATALAATIFASAAHAQDADTREADAILADIEAVEMPKLDSEEAKNPDAVRKFYSDRQAATDRKGTLIEELYKAHPEHPKVAPLMAERWNAISPIGAKAEEVNKEVETILAHPATEALKTEAGFIKARNALYANRQDPKAAIPAIDAFAAMAPDDDRAIQLLDMAATATKDQAERTALEDRIIAADPEGRYAGRIQGQRRQREAVGKPFELEFTDAVTGSTVSMEALKGKVVVIDFWATWCGPCIAELPNMKRIYSEYKDQGVEFIGVSLDAPEADGGLTKLKEFVADNEILWPQYYQGNGWESEFSSSWGINAIPALFVVAPDGNLHSVEARGELEEMIPALLEKKADSTKTDSTKSGN